MQKSETIAVIGLGYVGLPLALALARHYDVCGVESDAARLAELRAGSDRTGETSPAQWRDAAARLRLAASAAEAGDCSVFIITAPTPVFDDFSPDLRALKQATADVGAVLKKGDMAVFESTVCPGTTDDICAPLLSEKSGLRAHADFDCAYSPERVSPNDKGLSDAVKIVAAGSDAALARVAAVYGRVVPAGLHRAPSIKTAEAAKLAENIQRDADIAVTNELAMLFGGMGIDSAAVFEAAATKWNFRRFRPGFVGGHCIGVDSYYLLARAGRDGVPAADVIAAARRVNNAVPGYVAETALRLLAQKRGGAAAAKIGGESGGAAAGAKVVLFGFSFKENCADVRNTLVEPLRRALLAGGCDVRVCDPVADAAKARALYGAAIEPDVDAALSAAADMYIFAVAHRRFAEIPAAALSDKLVLDVKGIAARADWRL